MTYSAAVVQYCVCTGGLVASRLGRRHIGVELSLEYCRMAENRIYQDAPLLAGVTL